MLFGKMKMVKGATNAVKVILDMKSGENVLIVTDKPKMDIGKAFEAASKKIGANVKMYTLPQEGRPIKQIPADLEPLVPGNNVIINAFSGMAEETPFRISLIKKEIATNARVGHAPGISVEMMTKGPMTVDYESVAKNIYHMIDLFKDAKTVHITAPSGTDLTMNVEDRGFETDVKIKAGTFGNLPAGELWCGPVENGANGVIMCDGSIGDLGNVKKVLKMTVKKGKLIGIESEDKELESKVKELTAVDEMASVIGELGIGLNPGARLTGNLLEDEKAGETAHIAFGNNEEMIGGKNTSKTHRDFLFNKPTIEVAYKNGEKKILMNDGKLIL
ncbi:MAG: aminopeptidase [Candidatus Thermoplasmatota archaeon]|nr:aminopeptidase [Candidatus Thermoplasmatota archaeon]